MKISSSKGTAYNSLGAGIIPALFVSTIAVFWVMVWGMLIKGPFVEFGIALKGPAIIPMSIVFYSPYGVIAYAIHAASIISIPNLNWKLRACFYALCGAGLGVSVFYVQVTLTGVQTESMDVDPVRIMMIPGVLTALTVYALHGLVLYAVKQIGWIKEP